MTYYIGIDGGGTSTVGCIGTKNALLKTVTHGSSNYKGSGRKTAQENITSLLMELTSDLPKSSIKAICFGGAGVDSPYDHDVYYEMIATTKLTDNIIIVNDAKSGLIGALDDFYGAAVISGTGSIVYGIDSKGDDYRVGGWGHIIGDEGSGYTIGRHALILLSKYFDGMIDDTPLLIALRDSYKLHSKESLINFVYGEETNKAIIASVTKIVIDYYETDEHSKHIVNNEINLLVEQIIQLFKILGGKPMKLATIGSLLTKSHHYRNAFIKTLGRKEERIQVIQAINTPEVGAYKIALASDQ